MCKNENSLTTYNNNDYKLYHCNNNHKDKTYLYKIGPGEGICCD